MADQPLFNSPEQAITATYRMLVSLSKIVSWMALCCLHLAGLLLVALAMWWWQITPDQVRSVVQAALASTTLSVAGAVGLSLLGVLSAYAAAMRWIWPRTFGQWLVSYLISDLRS